MTLGKCVKRGQAHVVFKIKHLSERKVKKVIYYFCGARYQMANAKKKKKENLSLNWPHDLRQQSLLCFSSWEEIVSQTNRLPHRTVLSSSLHCRVLPVNQVCNILTECRLQSPVTTARKCSNLLPETPIFQQFFATLVFNYS